MAGANESAGAPENSSDEDCPDLVPITGKVKIPVTIITGFLGSLVLIDTVFLLGFKTVVVRRWQDHAA